MSHENEAHAHFWTLAEPWLAKPGVEKATMMGFPCLRVDGDFFASIEHKGDGLVIKLHRETVGELVADGLAEPFAPNGRVFKEWARIPWAQQQTWAERIDEAFSFVSKR